MNWRAFVTKWSWPYVGGYADGNAPPPPVDTSGPVGRLTVPAHRGGEMVVDAPDNVGRAQRALGNNWLRFSSLIQSRRTARLAVVAIDQRSEDMKYRNDQRYDTGRAIPKRPALSFNQYRMTSKTDDEVMQQARLRANARMAAARRGKR